MRKVLIISPYFPPINAADMQRIRMSLPYFSEYGWLAEVVTVNTKYIDITQDELLLKSIPTSIKIHKVNAFSKKWTAKFGLGSIALRSLYFYKRYVSRLLQNEHFDLIYFSTTQFPVLILGAYWKKKYNIPYIIDMQDPWHSDYYEDKPKVERPKKYWFSYYLNKWLEPVAMKYVNGLISVSEAYITILKQRYPTIKNIPAATITFGAFEKDIEIAEIHKAILDTSLINEARQFKIVYVGRGGHDMQKAVSLFFHGFNEYLKSEEMAIPVHFYFIGTSYAAAGKGEKTIEPIAFQLGLNELVTEQTDRISFYQALAYLNAADALFIPGSDDPAYTASKIYPYILTKKPILAIFNLQSSAAEILAISKAGTVANLNNEADAVKTIYHFFKELRNLSTYQCKTNWPYFKQFEAKEMTKKQCYLFDKCIDVHTQP